MIMLVVLQRNHSSPGNLTAAADTQQEPTTPVTTEPQTESDLIAKPLSLTKPPEKVHSDCVSMKSSRRSVNDEAEVTAGRTKSLPTNVCKFIITYRM